jgi:hypothetical protein
MAVDRAIAAMARSFDDFFGAIDLLIENKLDQPALALIYSTIDAAASLDRDPTHKDVERSDFLRWVDTYLLPSSGLACTSMDLYAARCGLLHAFAAFSALTRSGRARTIAYAWGKARVEDLASTILHHERADVVAVHVLSLKRALESGFANYVEGVGHDDQRLQRTLERAHDLYDRVDPETLQAYLDTRRQ